MTAEQLARRFHETYERLAPSHGYETRKESAKPWEDVPEQNKGLMIAVCGEILDSLREPSEAMLTSARDWSVGKYGRGVGNEDARGCWQAMLEAV